MQSTTMWMMVLGLVLASAFEDDDGSLLGLDDECAASESEACSISALQRQAKTSRAEECHDAVPGDTCYSEVSWAKKTGIHQHPHWYAGLTAASSDAEFQIMVHFKAPHKMCALPCTLHAQACHDALPGDACHNDVLWAKTEGIRQHPSWYRGLTPQSSDAAFQAQIHIKGHNRKCAMPCSLFKGQAATTKTTTTTPTAAATETTTTTTTTTATTTTTTATTIFTIPIMTTASTASPTQFPVDPEEAVPHPESGAPAVGETSEQQKEREARDQAQARQEQKERQAADRAKHAAARATPLDEMHDKLIADIGGEPMSDELPDDVADEDPDDAEE